MAIIFAQHPGDHRKFCFDVPPFMAEFIRKGMVIYVDTKFGPAVATATSDIICGRGAEDVAKDHGATFPLRTVISFVNDVMRERIKEEVLADARNALDGLLEKKGAYAF